MLNGKYNLNHFNNSFQEKKKREKDDIVEVSMGAVIAMDVDSVESSASSAMLAATSKVLGDIGMASPSSQSQFEVEIGIAGGNATVTNVVEPVVEMKPVLPFKQKPGEKQPFQKMLDHLLRVRLQLFCNLQ